MIISRTVSIGLFCLLGLIGLIPAASRAATQEPSLSPQGQFYLWQKDAVPISHETLFVIPTSTSTEFGNMTIRARYAGKFVKTIEDPLTIWYVSLGDLRRFAFNGDPSLVPELAARIRQSLSNKNIRISLSKQKVYLRYGSLTLAEYTVSSGKPSTPTPLGTFHILAKSPKQWSNAGGLWMPFWMQFTYRGHGLHELPVWPSGAREGSKNLGHAVSHGCVRLGIGQAKILYNWASIGTTVVVER